VAEALERLLRRREGLNSNPSTTKKTNCEIRLQVFEDRELLPLSAQVPGLAHPGTSSCPYMNVILKIILAYKDHFP
jgi:hypothetical protein